MSAGIQPNRWPIIGGVGFVAVLLTVVLARCGSNDAKTTTIAEAPPAVAVPAAARPSDADGTDATLKTMAANMEDNAKLKAQVEAQETTMRELRASIAENNPNDALSKVTESLTQLQQQNNALTERLMAMESRAATPTDLQQQADFGIPVGAVPGNITPAGTAIAETAVATPQAASVQPSYVWVTPLDRANPAGSAAIQPVSFTDAGANGDIAISAPPNVGADPGLPASSAAQISGATPTPRLTPRYTLPANATLLDATALTAFIGRVPVNGALTDGYRFKLLASADGLASNGYRLPPGIKNMVFSGSASGDWNLSCVRGAIDSVTFTYEDGSVQSYGAGIAVEGDGQGQNQSGNRRTLGYISDPQGVPCIKGEKVTNAPKILTARFITAALEATLRGYAEAQTSNTLTAAGGVVRTVNDAAKFGAFTGLAGGASETKDWLESRLGQIFDAVYAPPGQKVAIHLETQINLDQDAQGRRIDYSTQTTATRLD